MLQADIEGLVGTIFVFPITGRQPSDHFFAIVQTESGSTEPKEVVKSKMAYSSMSELSKSKRIDDSFGSIRK